MNSAKIQGFYPKFQEGRGVLSLCLRTDTTNPHFPEGEIDVSCSKLHGKIKSIEKIGFLVDGR